MQTLFAQNWLAFGAHMLTLAGVIIIFSITKPPQTSLTLTRDGVAGPSKNVVTNFQCTVDFPLVQKPAASINLYQGIIAFFVITALAHLLQATDFFGSGLYSSVISQGWNWFRWIEQALSAGIMTTLIGSADGTRNFITLMGLGLATMALQLNGLSIESMLRPTKEFNTESVLANTIAGWLLFVTIFLVILYNFFSIVSDVSSEFPKIVYPDAQVPVWLQLIGPLQFVYYASFGAVQLWQIYKRPNQADVEKWYIFLSFAAKISLAAGLAQGLALRQIGCQT